MHNNERTGSSNASARNNQSGQEAGTSGETFGGGGNLSATMEQTMQEIKEKLLKMDNDNGGGTDMGNR